MSQNEILKLIKKEKESASKEFKLFSQKSKGLLAQPSKTETFNNTNFYKLYLSQLGQNIVQKQSELVYLQNSYTCGNTKLDKKFVDGATKLDPIKKSYFFDDDAFDVAVNNYYVKAKNNINYNTYKLGSENISNIFASDNTNIESMWGLIDKVNKKNLINKNLSLVPYDIYSQKFLKESDTELVEVVGNCHYVKYVIDTSDGIKIKNEVLDQINSSLKLHLTYEKDIIERIKTASSLNPKKSGVKDILGMSKSDLEEFLKNKNDQQEHLDRSLSYLKSYLMVVEQNIEKLNKNKQTLIKDYTISIICPFSSLWKSMFTNSFLTHEDAEFSVYYLSKTKELVIVPEKQAIKILSSLIEDRVIDTPEVSKKITTFVKSNELFDYLDIGIDKIAGFSADILAGLKIDVSQNVDLESIDYNSKFNCGRVVVLSQLDALKYNIESLNGNILPLNQYERETFELYKDLKLPITYNIDKNGKLFSLQDKFDQLNGHSVMYIENSLHNIYLANDEYLSIERNHSQYKTFLKNDKSREVYSQPHNVWYISYSSAEGREFKESKYVPKSMSIKKELGIPLPLFVHVASENANKVANNYNLKPNGNRKPTIDTEMFITSIEDVVTKSINPVRRLLLGNNLKYPFLDSGSLVSMSNGAGTHPLGMHAVRYLSDNIKILTEYSTKEEFLAIADGVYQEVLSLFEKFDTVQLDLDESIANLWKQWFFGQEDYPYITNEDVIYFYKKIVFEIGTDGVSDSWLSVGGYRYLGLSKASLGEIFIKDSMGLVYRHCGEVLDYELEESLLNILAYNTLKGRADDILQLLNYNKSNNWHTLFATIYDRQVDIKGGVFENVDIESNKKLNTPYQRDTVMSDDMYFAYLNSDESTTIENLEGKVLKLAQNIASLDNYRESLKDKIIAPNISPLSSRSNPSIEYSTVFGKKEILVEEPVIVWLYNKVIEFKSKYSGDPLLNIDLCEVYNDIFLIIENINILVFPVFNTIKSNNKSLVYDQFISIISNYAIVIEKFLPIISKQIRQALPTLSIGKELSKEFVIYNYTNGAVFSTLVKDYIRVENQISLLKKNSGISNNQIMYGDINNLVDILESVDKQSVVNDFHFRYMKTVLNLAPRALNKLDNSLHKFAIGGGYILVDTKIDSNLLFITAQQNITQKLHQLYQDFKNNLIDSKNINNNKPVIEISYNNNNFENVFNKLKNITKWDNLEAEIVWLDLKQTNPQVVSNSPADSIVNIKFKPL